MQSNTAHTLDKTNQYPSQDTKLLDVSKYKLGTFLSPTSQTS